MHVLFGFVLMIGSFLLSDVARTRLPYSGLVNPAAMVLLALGPVAVALISHPWKEWASAFRTLLRAFVHSPEAAQRLAAEELSDVARAMREARIDEASGMVGRARSEQVRAMAGVLFERHDEASLDAAIAAASYRWMSEVRSADEFFQSLGRLCPAFGMIGTIMGLVDLFSNMRDSASLGPGMAMALLATLYGLMLCYCLYLPLAARLRTYLAHGVAEQRAVERAIHAIQGGRTVHEVRQSFEIREAT